MMLTKKYNQIKTGIKQHFNIPNSNKLKKKIVLKNIAGYIIIFIKAKKKLV